jgi:ATP-dependent DNA helicase RecG
MPDNTLFPTEITLYEPWVIREALHNCIAHQDYELHCRIDIIENPDNLLFVNAGSFIPRSVEAVIEHDAPQQFYRNKFLTEAMANLNMIDTIGSGIKRMFIMQRDRFFPLPDYDLSQPDKVRVRITGKIIDKNYTQLLINKTNLDLKTVILLDRVQKSGKILREEARLLKNQGVIEGRYPNIFVASKIADATGDRESYIRNMPFDKKYYKDLITRYIKEYGSASRQDIDKLLIDKISDVLSIKQKRIKISNLLSEMSKKDKAIENTGPSKKPCWILAQAS